jgi:sugar phosphate isomerase/epimerase
LSPEFYLDWHDLANLETLELEGIRASLAKAGLSCTIHGPYMELSPGGTDPEITKITRKRILKAVDAASFLKAETMVVHAAFDRFKYGGMFDAWLEDSTRFWEDVGHKALKKGVVLALENTLEDGPEPLCRLAENLDPNLFGHCFDIGHFNVFGRCSLLEWLESVRGRLLELHLHDNNGDCDQHLAIGDGTADFKALFDYISDLGEKLVLTVEAHEESSARRSMIELEKLLRQAQ